jgi:hypothetical protein
MCVQMGLFCATACVVPQRSSVPMLLALAGTRLCTPAAAHLGRCGACMYTRAHLCVCLRWSYLVAVWLPGGHCACMCTRTPAHRTHRCRCCWRCVPARCPCPCEMGHPPQRAAKRRLLLGDPMHACRCKRVLVSVCVCVCLCLHAFCLMMMRVPQVVAAVAASVWRFCASYCSSGPSLVCWRGLAGW